ncbi:SOS response-associated peptidase [Metabacillus malikii]|uniref:Abasic site processing protein n=1 Tax=Metabacillus malikii TaxID=1504265 RepID=A0ABT9ZDD5_9BACI|nr:SOS response-associated peptidase [Metabacillus malikii]MDQ0230025.1 putative SOS response-associated peptidase YedK [Metabacillus malikii]
MCGRFSLASDLNMLQEQFDFLMNEDFPIRYNIAPSQDVLVIGSNGHERIGKKMKWGLIPPWAKDKKIGYKMINARGETIDEKVSFKKPFQTKRCLILSDGFYEWKRTGKEKQPYRFIMKDNRPFAFAGLWEQWVQENENVSLYTCTIITTEANELTKDVHDRMPVILQENKYDEWLDRHNNDTLKLKKLLTPYDANLMEAYPVSQIVNSPKNDIQECMTNLNSL